MSENGTTTEQAPPMTRADYNKTVDQLSRGVYFNLGKAGFDKTTIEQLATFRAKDQPFENLPTKVKICLVKLAMSMMPIQPPEETKKEESEKVAAPEEQVKS